MLITTLTTQCFVLRSIISVVKEIFSTFEPSYKNYRPQILTGNQKEIKNITYKTFEEGDEWVWKGV